MANFSIIIPVYNECQNISKLLYELYQSIEDINNFEIIVVNDGSIDCTKDEVEKFKLFKVTLISHSKNLGQSLALLTGIKSSKNPNTITIDGDLQNDPRDILKLLNVYKKNEYQGLVSGIRRKRKDKFIKIISSKIANKFRMFILKDDCEDTGCSLKVFEKKVFLEFNFFNGIHRFLPVFFKHSKSKISYVDVNHRYRVAGKSKYGVFDRLFKGLFDIIRVKYYIIKNDKPYI